MDVDMLLVRREVLPEVFQKVVDLNTVLDKYDIEKKEYWAEFFTA